MGDIKGRTALSASVVSHTKNSIYIRWDLPDSQAYDKIHGYLVHYQAVGSTIMKDSGMLGPDTVTYELIQLHENTHYNICVRLYANTTQTSSSTCMTGTTAVDSLSVALGSAFGAFLALGFIVLLVFVAKWQHTRQQRKKQEKMEPQFDVYPDREFSPEHSSAEFNMVEPRMLTADDSNHDIMLVPMTSVDDLVESSISIADSDAAVVIETDCCRLGQTETHSSSVGTIPHESPGKRLVRTNSALT